MPHHPLSRSTRTLDMAQLAQLGDALGGTGAPRLTAGDLGVDPRHAPGSAVLGRVWWEGSPEFPYIYGDFSAGGGGPERVPLHTENLLKISHALGLHHRWGV
ncbi:MAG TPA: hypothetical protein VI248_23985 [Kineosporiaceae bacterium]